MSHEGEDCLVSLKGFLIVGEIQIIKKPRILTIVSIANLWEAWREWTEQLHRAENLVAVLDQTDAAHRSSIRTGTAGIPPILRILHA
jgi:hypothetical protein